MEKKHSEIKHLKPGSFVLIDDVPCKVDSIQLSKPGKHGGAKARVVASGVFTNIKKNIVGPASMTTSVPIIEKRNMQVIAFIGENAQLMDLEDYSTREVPMPEFELTEGDEVVIWVYGNYASIKLKK